MPRFVVTLRYADGETRTTTINASSYEDARQAVRDRIKAQMGDHRFGGDRDKGAPRIGKVKKA